MSADLPSVRSKNGMLGAFKDLQVLVGLGVPCWLASLCLVDRIELSLEFVVSSECVSRSAFQSRQYRWDKWTADRSG